MQCVVEPSQSALCSFIFSEKKKTERERFEICLKGGGAAAACADIAAKM